MLALGVKSRGVILPVLDLYWDSTTAASTVSVQLNTDGTFTFQNYNGAAPLRWFVPPTASVGAGYWVQFTVTGSAWNAGLTSATLYQLNANRIVAWTCVLNGPSKDATVAVNIYANSGGTILVAARTMTVHCFASNL